MNPYKNISEVSDKELCDSLKDDDRSSFKEIYKRYRSKLDFFVYRIINDKEVCEEIIQEVFIDLWAKRKEKEIENLSAYLYKAVRFQTYNQFRKKKIINEHIEEFDDFIAQYRIEEQIEYKDIYNHVNTLISQLPQQRRIIFQLSRDEELSNREIAIKLNISEQTVKNQINHALKFIRNSVKKWTIFLF
jgi:RNA polymerase sigma-70 factor (ECF subfamily)